MRRMRIVSSSTSASEIRMSPAMSSPLSSTRSRTSTRPGAALVVQREVTPHDNSDESQESIRISWRRVERVVDAVGGSKAPTATQMPPQMPSVITENPHAHAIHGGGERLGPYEILAPPWRGRHGGGLPRARRASGRASRGQGARPFLSAADEDVLGRFAQEARAGGALDHPEHPRRARRAATAAARPTCVASSWTVRPSARSSCDGARFPTR